VAVRTYHPGNVRSGDARYSDWRIVRRMALQARPYWGKIVVIFLLSLASAPLALLTPLPIKLVVDNVLSSHPLPTMMRGLAPDALLHSPSGMLWFAVGLLVGVTLLTYLTSMISALVEASASEGMVLDFRTRLFAHVQRLSLRYHDSIGTSDSTFRIQYDAPSVQQITVNGIIPLVSALTTLVGMIYVMARLDPSLAVMALSVAPALYWLTLRFRGELRQRWKAVKRLESLANSVVQEVLSSIRVVKAFGREDHEQARFFGRAAHRRNEVMRVSLLQEWFDLLVGMTMTLGVAGTLYLGASHVRTGVLTLGDLILVITYVKQLYDPLKAISRKMTDLQSALASAERAFTLLDEAPEVMEHSHARPLRRSRGEVRFEDVLFSYDGEHPVLRDVTLTVPAGTRAGIQGRTGAGKSTLMSLLTRFYDVSGGRILLDGVDIREYRLSDFRDQFGIVLQDAVLFSTTIAENISYGRSRSTEEEIVHAARLANAHDFIVNLPEGYATLVGERGMRLSGGERQRVALARAFLRDAPILILDEPTSALDTKTEAAILEALERLMTGRTTFVIAHRLGTLDGCDMQLEMRDGTLLRRAAMAAPAE
jgi:ATP-binding cassette subfamily B protein